MSLWERRRETDRSHEQTVEAIRAQVSRETTASIYEANARILGLDTDERASFSDFEDALVENGITQPVDYDSDLAASERLFASQIVDYEHEGEGRE